MTLQKTGSKHRHWCLWLWACHISCSSTPTMHLSQRPEVRICFWRKQAWLSGNWVSADGSGWGTVPKIPMHCHHFSIYIYVCHVNFAIRHHVSLFPRDCIRTTPDGPCGVTKKSQYQKDACASNSYELPGRSRWVMLDVVSWWDTDIYIYHVYTCIWPYIPS